jgi:carboxymethylenebutenolidase
LIEKNVEIPSIDGKNIDTYITCPDTEGPFPVIMLLMDAPGIRQELFDMASRIATSGYYVLVPNLYYRTTGPFKWNMPNLDHIQGYTAQESREVMFGHMETINNDLILQDIKDIFKYCEKDSLSKNVSIGLVGYCMSGPFAFYAAAKLNTKVYAAASIHGVKLFSESSDSPHLVANEIKGELYFGCAETDSYAPLEMIEKLEEYLSKTSLTYKIEIFPNTGHGFAFPNRGPLYSRSHSETHWFRILDLFERKLKN